MIDVTPPLTEEQLQQLRDRFIQEALRQMILHKDLLDRLQDA